MRSPSNETNPPAWWQWLADRPMHLGVVCAMGCFLAGLLAYALVASPSAPALYWPAGGIALAAGMLGGLHVAMGAGVGVAAASLAYGEPTREALLLGLATVAQTGVGLALLRMAKVGPRLKRLRDLLQVLLYGGLAAGLAAMPLGFLALEGVDGFWEQPLRLQVSSLLFSHLDSVLVFATLILCLAHPAYTQPTARRMESWAVLATVCGIATFLSHPEVFGFPEAPLRPYPILPFLLWLALRGDTRFVAAALAWVFGAMSIHVSWGLGYANQLGDQWIRPMHGFVSVVGLSFLTLAMLTSMNRRLEKAHLAEALAQRDALVREVHHRIKNNLQIVAGLLRRHAVQHPESVGALESAINQVQSIAVVHGLHGRVTQQGVMLCELVPAISRAISELSGVPVVLDGIEEGCGGLRIQENETTALALILNELLSNAVKHAAPKGEPTGPTVTLLKEGDGALLRIANPGRLPPRFDFANGEGLGTGLGLVKALMPSTAMSIEFTQQGDQVAAEMRLKPPLLNGRG